MRWFTSWILWEITWFPKLFKKEEDQDPILMENWELVLAPTPSTLNTMKWDQFPDSDSTLSWVWFIPSFVEYALTPTSGATASACASFCSCGKFRCFQGEEKSDKKSSPPKRSVQIGLISKAYQYIPSTFLTHHDVSSLWPTKLPQFGSPSPVAIAAPFWILCRDVFVA